MKKRYVLDSYAILTYLKEEPGSKKIRKALWDASAKKHTLFMNYINLGEVYYIIYRETGAAFADQIITMVKHFPINFVGVRESNAIIAGRIKAENKLSYADAYVVGTALNKKAIVLTGDKEFKTVEDIVAVEWLPRNR